MLDLPEPAVAFLDGFYIPEIKSGENGLTPLIVLEKAGVTTLKH
jgi:hypothetical protein